MSFLCPKEPQQNHKQNQSLKLHQSQQKAIIKLGGTPKNKARATSGVTGNHYREISKPFFPKNQANSTEDPLKSKQFELIKKNLQVAPLSSVKRKKSLNIQNSPDRQAISYLQYQLFTQSQAQDRYRSISGTPQNTKKDKFLSQTKNDTGSNGAVIRFEDWSKERTARKMDWLEREENSKNTNEFSL